MSKDNVSDFLKYAIENGKVKDLEEAFIEYPVEEEMHQGNIEYFLKNKYKKSIDL